MARSAAGKTDPRRGLPSVSVLLQSKEALALLEDHPRPFVVEALHQALDFFRRNLGPKDSAPGPKEILARAGMVLEEMERDRLRHVVNATGILLHTGLGRALLPTQAARALAGLDHCCNLQIDLATGKRGKRNYMSEQLLCRITGAEAAMITNNNAAATLLILAALCKGKEVIISRGQLIEIGGSYRLPDCIHQSGALLKEVGTTNRTHLRDYENAITENTGALLKCKTSNYKIIGFHKEVPLEDLVSLKKNRPGLLVIDDLGCGALVNLEEFGLPHEPTVQESVRAGADITCFSGDKLISGPQAGIIVGRKDLIAKIRKHPLSRMLRVGKLTDTALEHTLRLFLEPETLKEKHPTLRLLARSVEDLEKKARALAARLDGKAPNLQVRAAPCESALGGGSLPGVPIPSWCLAVSSPTLPPERLSRLLRDQEPPVIARVGEEKVHLDLRTILPDEEESVVEALLRVGKEAGS
ncbi:MAG TPA: L-seryl-tRNA(Sec) selenium transferase [Planctomycetes bacterium]|nr:L-seryl-tRNA(Sec) selenium transferase [Planctomycetota bacterium]